MGLLLLLLLLLLLVVVVVMVNGGVLLKLHLMPSKTWVPSLAAVEVGYWLMWKIFVSD